ncbi:MAG: type II toxin-antitoxin system RelB/DinJ family antitoxin [Clostridia bacterium]|nr:type II toxin-antitoxin system RelB/DinJ family antitoxin [Clostridia bacterium]
MADTVNLNVRIDKNLKFDAENIFNELGMNLTTALNLFLRSAVRYGGMPLDLRLNQDSRTTAEMKNDILRKVSEAEADFEAGRSMDAFESLRLLREQHGI